MRQEYLPVFVLGSPRSGTSTVAFLLKEHFGFVGHGEGHVFDLMYRLLQDVRSHFNDRGLALRGSTPPRTHWQGTITAGCIGRDALCDDIKTLFADRIGALYGQRWFDKTPGLDAIRCAPVLHRMYPQARFIFLIRDPVANVDSRLRKFPGIPFRQHCEEWAAAAAAWLQVRRHLAPAKFLELCTHHLSARPAETYRQVQALVGGGSEPPPVLPALERTALTDLARPRSLDEVAWSDADKSVFLGICGEIMQLFGFAPREPAGPAPTGATLPPPYGQPDVEVRHGALGGVWPEVRDGQVWIFMHPSADGEDTRLIYTDVEIASAARLRSRIAVINDRAPPVKFTIRVNGQAGNGPISAAEFRCEPGQERSIAIDLPPIAGRCAVEIVAQSTTGTVDNAWALIRPPVVEYSKAAFRQVEAPRVLRDAICDRPSA